MKENIRALKRLAIRMKYPILVGAAIISYLGARAIVRLIEPYGIEAKIKSRDDIEEPNMFNQIKYSYNKNN